MGSYLCDFLFLVLPIYNSSILEGWLQHTNKQKPTKLVKMQNVLCGSLPACHTKLYKIVKYHIIPWITKLYHAMPCNTSKRHSITCYNIEYHAIPTDTSEYNTIPFGSSQFHQIPLNTMKLCMFFCEWAGRSMAMLWARHTPEDDFSGTTQSDDCDDKDPSDWKKCSVILFSNSAY